MMTHLLAGWWTAIWPNLAASVIWAPAAFVGHHFLVRRHVDRKIERKLDDLVGGGD